MAFTKFSVKGTRRFSMRLLRRLVGWRILFFLALSFLQCRRPVTPRETRMRVRDFEVIGALRAAAAMLADDQNKLSLE